MQATLLSIAIAVILALLTALIGPHFVDWAKYRARFEAEATRVIGVPVRISGRIEARLLPTPSLLLEDVDLASGGNAPQVYAKQLSVEFALGPLLRGIWRASEVRLVQPAVRIGLNQKGAVDWPRVSTEVDPDRLAIDRLAIEDGQLVLSDAGSSGHLTLDHVSFSGEFRSLLGPARGEGSFERQGARFGYALAAGRLEEDALKVHVELRPGDRPWTAEADGLVHFVASVPEFDGSMKLMRPARTTEGAPVVPWRANGHVKASAANALFDKAEFQYGPEDRPLRLSGVVEIRFGKTPRYDAVVSGRQLDLDALLDLPESKRGLPAAAIQKAMELFSGPLKPPIPGRLGIGVESLTLAASPVRDLRGDLTSDANGWNLENLEFRAPGTTSARLSGQIRFAQQGVSFQGPATIEAADPRALLAWIEGRPAALHGTPGMLRASGQLVFAPDRMAVDQLQVEVDQNKLRGHLLFVPAQARQTSRLEVELTAAELDADDLVRIGPALVAGSNFDIPGNVHLAATIDRLLFAGSEAKNAALQLRYVDSGFELTRFSVGDLGGAALNVTGRVRSIFDAPQGGGTLELTAGSLDVVANLITKLDPAMGAAMRARMGRALPLDVRATLSVTESDKKAGQHAGANLVIEATGGAQRLHVEAHVSGNPADLSTVEINGNGSLSATEGADLIALLGLERWLPVEKGPGTARLNVRGHSFGKLDIDAKLAAAGLSITAKGPAHLMGPESTRAELEVSASGDAAPLVGYAGGPEKLPITGSSSAAIAGDKIQFRQIAGSIGRTPIHGDLAVEIATPPRISGRLEVEQVAVPELLASVLGVSKTAFVRDGVRSPEPFGQGLFDKLTGQVQLDAMQTVLGAGLSSNSLHTNLRFGAAEIGLDDIGADIGGGRLSGALAFHRDATGVSAHGRIALGNLDLAALGSGPGKAALSGRASLQVEAEGAGGTPAALIGSLNGGGTVSIESARVTNLDPQAFAAATRAADQGLPITAKKLSEVVNPALAAGELAIDRADGALTIVAGRVSISNLIAHGDGADVTLNGTLDLARQAIDARLALSGPGEGGAPGSSRPDLFIRLQGPVSGPERTVDVSALVNWLMLRALDRETKRMEAIERERQSSAPPNDASAITATTEVPSGSPALPAKPEAPPATTSKRSQTGSGVAERAPRLPPPIEIRPLPGAAPGGAPLPRAPAERSSPSIFDRLFGTRN